MPTPDYARLARRTLADADTVTLLIHGIGRFGSDGMDGTEVVMQDHDGWPTFACDTSSLLVQCVGLPALVNVPGHGSDSGRHLVLSGRLTLLERDPDANATYIGLAVDRVVVECDPFDGRPFVQHEVPVSKYHAAEPTSLAEYAATVMEHTNAHHDEELRRYAAGRTGLDVAVIAGASIAELDGCGATLHWVGLEGAHSLTIVFAQRAHSAAHLGCLLREQLIGAHQHGPHEA